MAYCTIQDLLVGDLTVGSDDLTRFVNLAAEEMDGVIGFDYQLPITIAGLPTHVALTLKRCNMLLASGRYILSQAVAGEDTSTHAYGASLLKEGQGILQSIQTGQLDLIGVARAPGNVESNAPTILQGDNASAIDAYYGNTGRPRVLTLEPGGVLDFWGPGR
jgi:hypothetical protein